MRAKFNQIISFSLKYAEMARIQDGGHFVHKMVIPAGKIMYISQDIT